LKKAKVNVILLSFFEDHGLILLLNILLFIETIFGRYWVTLNRKGQGLDHGLDIFRRFDTDLSG